MFMNLHASLTAAVLPFVLLSSVCAQPAQIQVNASQVSNSVSPYLGTGACLEDVNHEVYGGLYSQMIFGESFQEPSYAVQNFRDYGGGSVSVSSPQVTLTSNSGGTDEKLVWTGGNFSNATVSVQVMTPSTGTAAAGFILDVQNPSQGPDQFFGYEVVGDFSYSQPIQNPFSFSGAASGITTLEAHQKILNFAQQHGREVWFDVHVWTAGPGADPTLVALPTYVSALDQIANGAAHKVVVFELNADVHDQARAVGNALAINAISRITDPLPVVTSANCLQSDNENDNGWDQGLLFLNPYQVWLQPPGYVTQLFSNYYEPNLVASAVQSPGDVLDVTATKSTDGKTLVLRVVNISGKPIPTTINLAGFNRS